jgi:subtilisin-like proprotein convertase family protein
VFTLVQSLGRVLVLDDDELPVRPVAGRVGGVAQANDAVSLPESSGTTLAAAPEPEPVGQSANAIAQVLRNLQYVVTVEPSSSSDPALWRSYDLLVSSSGSNLAPISSAAYRDSLETYVATGGRLVVEGGEVLYAAANAPGYPSFAANVLHATDWDADDAGPLTLLGLQIAHPIARVPNRLPVTMPFAYSSLGNQDSYEPASPAYVVYGVEAQAGNGGILVYDDTPSLQSAQTVVMGFDFKRLADAETRAALLENVAAYLLRPEGQATGSIRGTVELAGRSDHSGVTVTALPGGQTTVTDAAGAYALEGIVAWTYDLALTIPSYEPVQDTIVVLEGQATEANFVLYPRPEVNECQSPGTQIPDSSEVAVTSEIVVGQVFPVRDLRVSVAIPHTSIGNLIVELRHGERTVRLHDRTGGPMNDLVRTYPPDSVDGPGRLWDFLNESSAGVWTLSIRDSVVGGTGSLAQWCLWLAGPADSNAVVAVEPIRSQPRVAWLAPGRPNPVSENGTRIGFALPRAEQVTLALYDISGRRVRTLVDRRVAAGEHHIVWDGKNDRGARVAPGVYWYRMRAGTFTGVRRLVVLR